MTLLARVVLRIKRLVGITVSGALASNMGRDTLSVAFSCGTFWGDSLLHDTGEPLVC